MHTSTYLESPWTTPASECTWTKGVVVQCWHTGEIARLKISTAFTDVPEELGVFTRLLDEERGPNATLPSGLWRLTELTSLTLNGKIQGTLSAQLDSPQTHLYVAGYIGGTIPT
jgi:hypothetical protein